MVYRCFMRRFALGSISGRCNSRTFACMNNDRLAIASTSTGSSTKEWRWRAFFADCHQYHMAARFSFCFSHCSPSFRLCAHFCFVLSISTCLRALFVPSFAALPLPSLHLPPPSSLIGNICPPALFYSEMHRSSFTPAPWLPLYPFTRHSDWVFYLLCLFGWKWLYYLSRGCDELSGKMRPKIVKESANWIESHSQRSVCVCVSIEWETPETLGSEKAISNHISTHPSGGQQTISNLSKCDFVASAVMRSPEIIIIIFRFFIHSIDPWCDLYNPKEMYTFAECSERTR